METGNPMVSKEDSYSNFNEKLNSNLNLNSATVNDNVNDNANTINEQIKTENCTNGFLDNDGDIKMVTNDNNQLIDQNGTTASSIKKEDKLNNVQNQSEQQKQEQNNNNDNHDDDDDDEEDDLLKDAVNAHDDSTDTEDTKNTNVESSDSRPRRKATKSVNYKEKTESDIPITTTFKVLSTPSRRGRRPKSLNEPSPNSPTPISSSSTHLNSNLSYKNNMFFDIDQVVPINYQPPVTSNSNFNEIIDTKGAKINSSETVLTLKSGQTIKKGDCIYMVCEPASEPYYIAQVLGFTKKDKTATNKKAINYMFSVCWFYRPRDLNRRAVDTRLVYASLHRDDCPLSSFRGFATVKHKYEISDLESYKQQPDSFFFDKLYDRYMIKMYDMIPTIQLTHLPPNYYKALHKRFEYIFVEVGKADELLSSPKNCEKCLQWCSSKDSIGCSGCSKSYHLLCLDPPILTKPKRGFAWYCAACNKLLEEKLAKNRGKMLESSQPSMIKKHEEREALKSAETDKQMSDDQENDREGSNSTLEADSSSLRYEQLAKKFLEDDKNVSLEERRLKEEWPYRYLGVHAKFEDALDIQDRPYARAASRLGTKYQCTSITEWFDHKVQYYDTGYSNNGGNNKKLKKYYNRSKKSSDPLPNDPKDEVLENKKFPIPEEYKNIKPKEFPGWLQPKPKGYIERGSDETSDLLWKMPDCKEIGFPNPDLCGKMVEEYIEDCKPHAEKLKLATSNTPNFYDAVLLILMNHKYNPKECMDDVHKLTRDSLKEPTLNADEIKRFEDSVRIHGSELYPVFKDVKTQPSAMVVRFYYLWKKTKSGHEIWDNFPGRTKNKMRSTKNGGVDLDNTDDDGAFSNSKVSKSHFEFKCLYCETNHSSTWFRAPSAIKDDSKNICEGLCYRCARLWRKYAAKWENPIELYKNQQKKGTFVYKKKVEQELLNEAEKVVEARENYKLHPRKISQGIKKFKTIDTDYDFTTPVELLADVSTKPKKRAYKKQSPQIILTTTPKTNEPKKPGRKPKVEVMETKFSVLTPVTAIKPKRKYERKALKRPADETSKESEVTNEKTKDTKEIIEEPVKKKRAYKRKQQPDKLKFVLVGNKESELSTPTPPSNPEATPPSSAPSLSIEFSKYLKLKDDLSITRKNFEKNAKSNNFNAFLDMKLRESIEIIEKELASVADYLYNQNIPEFSSIKKTVTKDLEAKSAPAGNHPLSGKKYVRRRLFLSKTSVPGTGVFETPPIQLPPVQFTPDESTSNSTPGLESKDQTICFKMYNSNTVKPTSEAQFQSQPNLLPTVLSRAPVPTIFKPETPVTFNHPEKSSNPKTSDGTTTIKEANDNNEKTADIKSLTKKVKSNMSSPHDEIPQGFISGAMRNNEFITLKPSFKVKMLTPLIDYNDSITKNMLTRYSSKYDVFNPLLSDDFYISPIFQMRPASKELHLLWKQYQTSRKTKGKIGKQFQRLFDPKSRPCCVCREIGDTFGTVICSNCGLNVHASCYGIELKGLRKEASLYNWHCDPCSNDLHPLISTQYICLLCNSRESNMDNAIKGDPSSIPDALKRTVEGRWCHVSCSFLCNEVKYGSKSLQPIFGAPVTGIKNIFNTCSICLGNGGSIVNCEFCANNSHVTCGLDFGWKLGFLLIDMFDCADGDVIQLKNSGKIGKLKPAFICDKHDASTIVGLHSLNDIAKKLDKQETYKTLFQLFYQDERKLVPVSGNGSIRRLAYDQMSCEFDQLIDKSTLQNSNPLTYDPASIEEFDKVSHSCGKCFRTCSLQWHKTPDGIEVCHLCYKTDKSKKLYIPDLSLVNTKNFDNTIYGA